MTALRPRRVPRALALAATGGLAVLTLSGCLSMNADLTVNSDAKTSGTFAVGLQKQAAGMLGMTDLGTFEQGLTSEEMSGEAGGLFESGECVASETDAEYVYTCSFSDVEFKEGDGPWAISKEGDVITFHMVNDGATGESAEAAELVGGSMGDITVNVTFPGAIQTITGDGATKNSDTSATVKVAMTDAADITITSAASGGGGMGSILLIVGLVLLALIVIAVIIVLVTRGKKSAPAAPGAAVVVAEPMVEEPDIEKPAVDETPAPTDNPQDEQPPQ